MGKAKGKRLVTRDSIVATLNRLEAVVDEWRDAPSEHVVIFRGSQVVPVSAAIEACAKSLFEMCDTVDIEEAAHSLVLEIDDFEDQILAFAERMGTMPHDTDPSGTVQMWRSYERMLEARNSPKNKMPEPIRQLVGEQVPRYQIAKIYGWYLDDGVTPDVTKLDEEIENPGTHFNPEKWVHPTYRKFKEEIAAKWAKRCEMFEVQQEEKAKQAQLKKREAPETIDELMALPGITVKQIAKMKKMKEDEVREYAESRGIAIEGATAGNTSYLGAQLERERRRQESIERAMQEQ